MYFFLFYPYNIVEKAASPVPMDTSLVKKQKQPDSNLPSDSESAN